ncbi:MAG: secondary thiamine-phosphate synthase enzyme YjbQ [Candidatus Kapaibacterium sp.]
MAIKNYSFGISTKGFTDIRDISEKVLEFINNSGIKNGSVLVYSPGSTCGITTLEFEPGCVRDLKQYFERAAPEDDNYAHNERWGDGNGFSHVRAAMTKSFFQFPVIDSIPVLGTWQQIIFIDFDNKSRNREIIVQIQGE